jgi:hypothetical protein
LQTEKKWSLQDSTSLREQWKWKGYNFCARSRILGKNAHNRSYFENTCSTTVNRSWLYCSHGLSLKRRNEKTHKDTDNFLSR